MEKGIIVVDASALLAIYLQEPTAGWVVDQMNGRPEIRISPLTITETLIRVRDLRPASGPTVEKQLLGVQLSIVPIDASQAVIAAEVRLRYPLNLGDCFVYALARVSNATILTLDRDFKRCDVPVLLPD